VAWIDREGARIAALVEDLTDVAIAASNGRFPPEPS
jgi:hypothetical protein